MKKQRLIILAAAIAVASAPAAHADTFLQFLTQSGSTVNFDGSTISGSATVDLSYLDPEPGAPTTATFTFSGTAVAGSAALIFGDDYENLTNISFSILNGGTNILSGTAATGYILGGGAGFDVDAEEPGNPIVFTSSIYGPMTDLGFQISTGPPSTLGITAGNLDAFSTTVGPSAFIGTPAPTPEPSSLVLLGTGILGVAGVLRRRLTV
jgi:hypothetical protein